MIPGISRQANLVILCLFSLVIAIPLLVKEPHQPYLHLYGLFLGGMIGAAWGRGIHASLRWQDYAIAAVVLAVVDIFFGIPFLLK